MVRKILKHGYNILDINTDGWSMTQLIFGENHKGVWLLIIFLLLLFI